MKINKKVFVSVLILAMFVLGGCSSYTGMTSQEEEGISYVPLEDIIVEPTAEEEVSTEEVAEEEKTAGENITEVPTEEVTEEIPSEEVEATTVIVQETEKVSLQPKGYDPDQDKLTYTFTSPLNTAGEWQTKYGDAGEYRITVTASDSKLTASKEVLLIVNKKEEAPTIDSFMPKEKMLKADENTKTEFSVAASDLNKDVLAYSWKLDGEEVSEGQKYTYDITYDSAGSHTVKIDVSDGTLTSTNIWSLTVNNINRKPVLERIPDITAKETEKIIIRPKATDPDNDKLEFSVDNANFKKVNGAFEWDTTYDDAGPYTVKVSVTDGEDTVSQDVKIAIENVNRPPVITDIIQKK